MKNKVPVTKESLDVVKAHVTELFLHHNHVKVADMDSILSEVIELLLKKNHDYGDAWQRFGIFTPLIRINDKILRVETLASGEKALVADEGIKDTLTDIAGYAILALLKLNFEVDYMSMSPSQRLDALGKLV